MIVNGLVYGCLWEHVQENLMITFPINPKRCVRVPCAVGASATICVDGFDFEYDKYVIKQKAQKITRCKRYALLSE
jgi:hypothetical protein